MEYVIAHIIRLMPFMNLQILQSFLHTFKEYLIMEKYISKSQLQTLSKIAQLQESVMMEFV
jgi:hypothetical protein